MSKRRKKESVVYAKKRKAFLDSHPICQICGKRPATEIHHTKHRHSGNYLNESTFLALCGGLSGCHAWVHAHPALAREMGYLG